MFLHKRPYLPLREKIGALHLKGFPKLSLFTKFSLFLTLSGMRYTDLIIGHQNNSFDSGVYNNSNKYQLLIKSAKW